MPKVYWSEPERKKDKMREYIVGRANRLKLSQEKIAFRLKITQQGYSHKLKTMTFKPVELITLFELLESTDDEILNLMKTRR